MPFGESNAEQKVAGFSTKYRFTSKELDDQTGLYYFGARYYNPRISVWYGVDALKNIMPTQGAFNYCYNNPIILIDPDGEKPSPREAALIAAHSYGDQSIKLEG